MILVVLFVLLVVFIGLYAWSVMTTVAIREHPRPKPPSPYRSSVRILKRPYDWERDGSGLVD